MGPLLKFRHFDLISVRRYESLFEHWRQMNMYSKMTYNQKGGNSDSLLVLVILQFQFS